MEMRAQLVLVTHHVDALRAAVADGRVLVTPNGIVPLRAGDALRDLQALADGWVLVGGTR